MVDAASSAELASIANTIRDGDIKFLFKRLSKRQGSDVIAALKELNDRIPTMDYDTTFSEIVGHICLVFDYFFFSSSEEVRVLVIGTMRAAITRLDKDLTNYATLIFPTLMIYTNDDREAVSMAAKEVMDKCFGSREKKIAFIGKIHRDICAKIVDVVGSLTKPGGFRTAESSEVWGRVASAVINLALMMVKGIKMNRALEDVIASLRLSEWMKPGPTGFMASARPNMRKAAYELLVETYKMGNMMCNPAMTVEFVKCEDTPAAQEVLLRLLLELLREGKVEKVHVKEALIASVHLYADTSVPNFMEIIEVVGDDEFLDSCIEKAVEMEDGTMARALCTVFMGPFKTGIAPKRDFLLGLFERMLRDELTVDLTGLLSLDMVGQVGDQTDVDEVMIHGSDKRCMDYFENLSEERLKKWLSGRVSVSSQLAIKVCDTFGSMVLRDIWDTVDAVPISDKDDPAFVDFMVKFVERKDLPAVVKGYRSVLPNILHKWERDFKILSCPDLKAIVVDLLEEDISLARTMGEIFGNDADVADAVHAVVDNIGHTKEFIDSSVFEHFPPKRRFLENYLMSGGAAGLPKDHVLIPHIRDLIPQLADRRSAVELARAVIAFVEGVDLCPLEVLISGVDSPDLFYEYWSYFGFELVAVDAFCRFLDVYIEKKAPWMHVFLYIKKVSWKFIPHKLWDAVSERPHLVETAHSQKLLLAMSCICTAKGLGLDAVPNDTFTLQALSHIEPKPELSDDKLMRIIHIEWNHVRPKVPDFEITSDTDLELTLRQTVSYLRFYLPTLLVFDPVYELLIKGLENPSRLSFFFCIRIFSMICEATSEVPAAKIVRMIMPYLVKFAPFITVLENELVSAFKVTSFLSSDDFNEIIGDVAPLFSSGSATQLIRVVIPLIRYFNAWNLMETELGGTLDIHNPQCWNFITSCLLEMPARKRADLIPKYSKIVPSVLNDVDPVSREFELVVMTLPYSVRDWFGTLEEQRQAVVRSHIEKRVALKVFKSIVKHILHMKLQGTVVKSNPQRLTMEVTFREDASSMPITLELRLPPCFPLDDIQVRSDIGDTHMSTTCDQRVVAAMKVLQSIEEGVRTWHEFVVARVLDTEPCLVCFGYFDDRKCTPDIGCATCKKTFHRSCLKKWFEKSLRPTCPGCTCAWVRKGR